MTKIYEEEVTCAVCGAKQTVQGDAQIVASADYRVQLAKSVVGGDAVLLADIARRAGEFAQALGFCDAGLKVTDAPEFVTKLLAYQRDLVLARDAGCHSVPDIEAPAAKGTLH